jgi:hypothetical protein
VNDLNTQAAAQALPQALHAELRDLLVCSTHRIAKARDIASKFLNRLITSFPSLMCDPPLVFAILEVLTLLGRACENEFTDEVSPCMSHLIQWFDAIRFSITTSMNSIPRVLESLYSFPMTIKSETRYWLCCIEMRTIGSN